MLRFIPLQRHGIAFSRECQGLAVKCPCSFFAFVIHRHLKGMILIDENGSFINRIVLKGIKQHPVAHQEIVLFCTGTANSKRQYNGQEK